MFIGYRRPPSYAPIADNVRAKESVYANPAGKRESASIPYMRFPHARGMHPGLAGKTCVREAFGDARWDDPKRNLSFSKTFRRWDDLPGQRRYDAAGRFRPDRSAHLRHAGRCPLPTSSASSPWRSPSDTPPTFSDQKHPKRRRRACHSSCTFRGYHRQVEARSTKYLQRNCAQESRPQMSPLRSSRSAC